VLGSIVVYAGFAIGFLGLMLLARPIPRLGVPTRRRALVIMVLGALVTLVGLVLPATESRIAGVESRIDEFVPAWQFAESHHITIDAPPDRVFEAVWQVTADEIALFRMLTWIRRGGQAGEESILNPGDPPILEVATSSGFILLADDPPRELVIGTAVVVPPNTPIELTPGLFQRELAPGFALAAMNFAVEPAGSGSRLTTETRVFANSATARRRFAVYWRLIYPGSALLRRSWLRAIQKRVTLPPSQ
jgi:hypothetical protein